jgi:UDP-glucose 4-epimerase
MKKFIVVTGGCGFIGSNLIRHFLEHTKYNLICIDNYSSGSKKNHIKDKRITYIKGHTKNISKYLERKKKDIDSIFHFGEYSRIYQSFKDMNECIQSNTIGSNEVFSFCLKNKIKLIYSATSASLGNNGDDKNLSPYAFTKSKNLELLENLKMWFGFKYEVIFFYNVYGPGHIMRGKMATVIGIFEDNFIKKTPLPVVRPGTQTRRFTHINDTIEVCFYAWKQKKNRFYSISNKKKFTILQVAKLFSSNIKLLPERKGERYASALTELALSNKIFRKYGKIQLKDYIQSFKQNILKK